MKIIIASLLFAALAIAQSVIFVGGNVAFSPSQFASPSFWYRYDNVTFDGSNNVTTWTDQSTAGRNATAGIAHKPTYETNQINGHPAVKFNLGYLQIGSIAETLIATNQAFSIYAVVQRTGYGSGYPTVMELNYGVNDGLDFLLSNQTGYSFVAWGSGGVGANWGNNRYSGGDQGTGWQWIVLIFSGSTPTSAASWTLYVQGVSKTIGAASGFGDTSGSAGKNYLGALDAGPNLPWVGYMAEVGLWQTDITSSMAQLATYVNTQYGL